MTDSDHYRDYRELTDHDHVMLIVAAIASHNHHRDHCYRLIHTARNKLITSHTLLKVSAPSSIRSAIGQIA